VEQLRGYYNHRHAAAWAAHQAGKPVIGLTSNTVPRELIAAAGMVPLLLSPQEDPPPKARHGSPPHEIFMEDGFDARSRALFDFLVSGSGGFLKSVIIPRTSEQDHKLFLYLKEVRRQQNPERLPDVWLYNLLHTRSDEARDYSRNRTADLKRHLETLAGREIDAASLKGAIRAGNESRAAARDLVRLREAAAARLSGSDALPLLGARYFMDATEYARLASAAAREIEQGRPFAGPRILIKGYSLDHPCLHREIESHGAIVFAEDDAWGSRGATPDIATEGDPLEAVFEHYYSHVTSARVFPLEVANQWFRDKARLADGVVFYLPPNDDVIGWDYPQHRAYLDELGVPHVLIRVDAAGFPANAAGNREPGFEEARGHLADLVARARSKRES
jgi:benzoyl-CoA reductase subunit C